MVYMYYKGQATKFVNSIKREWPGKLNISDRTRNVFYDNQIIDAHVIRITLLKKGYKIITKPLKAI